MQIIIDGTMTSKKQNALVKLLPAITKKQNLTLKVEE